MGYPMTWQRLVSRNGLHGGYTVTSELQHHGPRHIAGDMRRLEQDSRDALHLVKYARYAGITRDEAQAVLDAFFDPRLVTDILTWPEHVKLYEEVHGKIGVVNVQGD